MSALKSILQCIAVYIITAAVLIALFLAAARIPGEKIQTNMAESAECLQGKGAAFPFTTTGIACGKAAYCMTERTLLRD